MSIKIILISLLFLTSCTVEDYRKAKHELNQCEQVLEAFAKEIIGDPKLATWYDYDLNREDQKCRSNDCYSMFNATCASRDYPKGTFLTVRNRETKSEVVCRVNDYGPEESTGRHIDLSSFAFKKIAPLDLGVIEVDIYE